MNLRFFYHEQTFPLKINIKEKKIGIAVFSDGCIFKDKILEKVTNEKQEWIHSLFLMVCLRIGSISPNEEYFPMVKYLLESPYSVGILGGKPRRALYFVGYQDDNLIIKDPHYVQVGLKIFLNLTLF